MTFDDPNDLRRDFPHFTPEALEANFKVVDFVRVVTACICGSDLWPFKSMPASETGARIGYCCHLVVVSRVGAPQYDQMATGFPVFLRNVTLTGGVAPARSYIPGLLPDVLDGRIQPGKVFDPSVSLHGIADGYTAMADRTALKVLVRP